MSKDSRGNGTKVSILEELHNSSKQPVGLEAKHHFEAQHVRSALGAFHVAKVLEALQQAQAVSEAGTVGELGMRYAYLEMETEHERQRLHRQLSEKTQHNTEVTLRTIKIDSAVHACLVDSWEAAHWKRENKATQQQDQWRHGHTRLQ
jgi:hypothetical protein